MIILRKYGHTIEITKTQKDIKSSRRGLSSTRKTGGIIELRRADSIRRTKRICLRKLLSAIEELGAPLFFTLTFQGSASDVLVASRRLSYFQRRLQIEFSGCQSLFIPELSSGGRIHYHGLVFGLSQDWGNSKEGKRVIHDGREESERKFAQLWGYGFVDILKTDGSPRLATYLTKYVAKGSGEPLFAPVRLVRCSKGFPTEQTVRGEHAECLMGRYEHLKPSFEAEFYTPFLGTIKKQFFDTTDTRSLYSLFDEDIT